MSRPPGGSRLTTEDPSLLIIHRDTNKSSSVLGWLAASNRWLIWGISSCSSTVREREAQGTWTNMFDFDCQPWHSAAVALFTMVTPPLLTLWLQHRKSPSSRAQSTITHQIHIQNECLCRVRVHDHQHWTGPVWANHMVLSVLCSLVLCVSVQLLMCTCMLCENHSVESLGSPSLSTRTWKVQFWIPLNP